MRLLPLVFLLLSNAAVAATDEIENLIAQSKTLLEQGHYYLALDNLQMATAKVSTAEQQTRIEGLQGLTHYRMHHYQIADNLLSKAIKANLADLQEQSRWTAVLAENKALHGKIQEAQAFYAEAIKLAGNDKKLLLGIRLSQLILLPLPQRLPELQTIYKTITEIQPASERASYFLNLATQSSSLGSAAQELTYQSFTEAKKQAPQNSRLLAAVLNGLAQLYEQQNRYPESLQLNNQGLAIAQAVQAQDLLIELNWRLGRLLQHNKQSELALQAYQSAIENVEAIRQDIPVEYHDGRSSFRETLEPLYLGLADLLLRQAKQQDGDKKNALLYQARETVELLKQSEVEDFLGGRCAVQSNKAALLETIEPKTAILYPILLPDRLELLLSTGTDIQQYTQPVAAKLIQKSAREMAKALRNAEDGKVFEQQLYNWLIAPLEPWLQQQQIQTLVIVADGALRLIPLAALHNGKQYLIERYAIASSPGLTLMQSKSIQQHGLRALLAGMSKPGNVIEHLPPVFFNAISASVRGRDANKSATNQTFPAAEIDNNELSATTRNADIEKLLRQPTFRRQVEDELSLPGVADEINSLKQEMPNNTLIMNEQFTLESFKAQITNYPYSVVHIASHGLFENSAESSFIMAYDNVINVNELENLFKAEKFRRQPVELLTLSACQTAEGNDRAPLGLAGMAIKTKVRTALGTLWSVSDEATFKIMTEFYHELQQPGLSKAQALRQAQIMLMRDKELEHPFFWAPFILVGNWK